MKMRFPMLLLCLGLLLQSCQKQLISNEDLELIASAMNAEKCMATNGQHEPSALTGPKKLNFLHLDFTNSKLRKNKEEQATMNSLCAIIAYRIMNKDLSNDLDGIFISYNRDDMVLIPSQNFFYLNDLKKIDHIAKKISKVISNLNSASKNVSASSFAKEFPYGVFQDSTFTTNLIQHLKAIDIAQDNDETFFFKEVQIKTEEGKTIPAYQITCAVSTTNLKVQQITFTLPKSDPDFVTDLNY